MSMKDTNNQNLSQEEIMRIREAFLNDADINIRKEKMVGFMERMVPNNLLEEVKNRMYEIGGIPEDTVKAECDKLQKEIDDIIAEKYGKYMYNKE